MEKMSVRSAVFLGVLAGWIGGFFLGGAIGLTVANLRPWLQGGMLLGVVAGGFAGFWLTRPKPTPAPDELDEEDDPPIIEDLTAVYLAGQPFDGVQLRVLIERPLTAVYDYIANFENHAAWQNRTTLARNISNGSGTVYEWRMTADKTSGKLLLTDTIPQRHIAFAYREMQKSDFLQGEYRFEAVEDGTWLTYTQRFSDDPSRPEMLLFAHKTAMWRDLYLLKQILES